MEQNPENTNTITVKKNSACVVFVIVTRVNVAYQEGIQNAIISVFNLNKRNAIVK